MDHRTAPLAFVLLASTSALAQQPELRTTEEIVVTASRSDKPLSSIPNTVTVIDERALARQIDVNADLSTILGNLVPSFSPSRQKMTSHGESLRGRDPLYMVDGVPQSNPLRDGSRDSYTIDPLMLDRVEVIHSANAIHGLGASGGIINLVTRRPTDTRRQSLRVESFAQDEDPGDSLGYGLNYSYSGRWDAVDLLASVGYRATGVGYDANGEIIGFDNTQGDTMDSDMLNLFAKTGYDWDDQRVELTINDFEISGNDDWVGVDGDYAAGIPTTALEGAIPGDVPTNDVTMLSLNYTNAAIAGQNLRVQAFRQDFAATYGGGTFATFQDPAFGPDVFDQSQNNSEKTGTKITLIKDELGGLPLSIVYGLDVLNDKTFQRLVQTSRNWVPETDYANRSLFVQGEFSGLERFIVTTGARYEKSTLEVDDFTTLYSYNGGQFVAGGEPDFSEALYNAGATFQVTDALRLFASYSEGFSMPDVGRVLRGINLPGQDVETFLDLTPIVTENTEIGFEYTADTLSFQLSYYASDADFGQRLAANADGIYSVEREKTEIDGVELRAEWFATPNDTLGLRLAHTDGQYDSDDDGTVDTDLSGANMSPQRINLSWERAWSERIETRLQINHLLDRDFDDSTGAVATRFDGYTTVDFSGEIETSSGVLSLGAHNLTNEDYFTYYSQTLGNDARNFKGLGRTVKIGYRLEF